MAIELASPEAPLRAKILVCCPLGHVLQSAMIKTIKHRGLRQLYEQADRSGIGANMRDRVERILFVLDQAETP